MLELATALGAPVAPGRGRALNEPLSVRRCLAGLSSRPGGESSKQGGVLDWWVPL